MPKTYSRTNEMTAWLAAEATYDTAPGSTSADTFVAGDHIRVLDVQMNATIDRMPLVDEKDGTQTVNQTVDKRITAEGVITGYYRHAGTLSGLPHQHLLTLQGLGQHSAGGGELQYNPVASNTSSLSLMYADKDNLNMVRRADGVAITSYKLTTDGDGILTYEAAFTAADVIATGRGTLASNGASAGLTTIPFSDTSVIMSGSIISTGSEQIKITSVDNSGGTAVVQRGWGTSTAAVIASGAAFTPWKPSTLTAPTQRPIAGVLGAVTLNGTTITTRSVNIEWNGGKHIINDDYGTNKASAIVTPAKRECFVEFDPRLERDLVQFLIGMDRHKESPGTMLVQFGTTAGTDLVEFTAGTVELETSPEIDTSGNEEVSTSMRFRCINSTDDTEYRLTQK